MSDVPDSTAVRVALWRALHVEHDAPPHILDDTIGLRLAAPPDGWRDRPDMNPEWTAGFRAHIVARARFVEDLIAERGATQYVLLGAGLDTYAQRGSGNVRVFEIDQPATSTWKRDRLTELGLPLPVLVPVDFERRESWRAALAAAGFDRTQPTLVASTGVTQYLTAEANLELLAEVASLAPGTTAAITFMLPIELLPADERPGTQIAIDGARRSGTPFLSFYAPEAFVALAKSVGFADVRHVSTEELAARYAVSPAHGEQFIVATV